MRRLAVQEAVHKWQRRPTDTGSGEVQVAVFTERIKQLSEHMGRHHKDKMTKRRPQMLVLQKRLDLMSRRFNSLSMSSKSTRKLLK